MVRRALLGTVFVISFFPVAAHAQLTIDMNSIKCDQYLAMSPEMSRDFSAWMSGWFSYQNSPDICRYRLTPEKHRQLESVVPIPSARKRGRGRLARSKALEQEE